MRDKYIITDVPGYRPFHNKGTVVNPFTLEPRLFPTREAAASYRDLSLMNGTIISVAL